jgi:hypothetical protein
MDGHTNESKLADEVISSLAGPAFTAAGQPNAGAVAQRHCEL